MKRGTAPAKKRVAKKSRPTGQRRAASATSAMRVDAFVEAMISGANITQTDAAIAAGYAPRSAHVQASRLMADPMVRDRIKEAQARREAACAMSARERMDLLVSIARGEVLAPIGIAEGCAIEAPPKHADRIKSIDILNKMTGAYPDLKHKVEVSQVPATAEQLRAALEQAQRVEEMRKRLGS